MPKGFKAEKPVWRLRLNTNVKLYQSGDELINNAQKYFDFLYDNPLLEQDFVGKDAKEVSKNKARMATIEGLCNVLGITSSTYRNYQKNTDLSEATSIIDDAMRMYNLEHAGAGLINAQLASRYIGLAEKREIDTKGNITIEYTE